MLKKEDIEKIKNEVEEFFKKMGVEVEVEILPQKDLTLPINLKTADFEILIGEEGKNLFAIQHLLKAILKRKINEEFYIDLDIAGYKKKKITYLKELARSVADEVSLTKKERVLEPMSAFERRIIHLELASRPDVTTESIGKEPKRRVVIKPYP
jgi:spoIIIJ-associated protein